MLLEVVDACVFLRKNLCLNADHGETLLEEDGLFEDVCCVVCLLGDFSRGVANRVAEKKNINNTIDLAKSVARYECTMFLSLKINLVLLSL